MAKALGELSHLECWEGKQANRTSQALVELLANEEVTRHATLQNRAAIDYLLLFHGHGREEFEDLCCFNLSSHTRSITKTIQEMRDQVHHLKTEGTGWLQNMLGHWGIPGWGAALLQVVFPIITTLFIIICLLAYL